MSTTEIMTKKEIEELATRTSTIMHTIKLQNDLYNFVPSPRKINEGEVLINYKYLNDALGNVFELNQSLENELDDITAKLYDLSERLEESNTDELK